MGLTMEFPPSNIFPLIFPRVGGWAENSRRYGIELLLIVSRSGSHRLFRQNYACGNMSKNPLEYE